MSYPASPHPQRGPGTAGTDQLQGKLKFSGAKLRVCIALSPHSPQISFHTGDIFGDFCPGSGTRSATRARDQNLQIRATGQYAGPSGCPTSRPAAFLRGPSCCSRLKTTWEGAGEKFSQDPREVSGENNYKFNFSLS